MKTHGRLLLWLMVCSTFLVGLYTLLPRITASLIQYQLARAGLQEPQVQIDKLGLHTSTIANLSFIYKVSGKLIRVDSGPLNLDYDLAGLLKTKLDRITILQAHISVLEDKSIANSELQKADKEQLPSLLDLPVRVIDIRQLRVVNALSMAHKVTVNVSGYAQHDGRNLTASAQISKAEVDTVLINLHMSNTGALKIEASLADDTSNVVAINTENTRLGDKHLDTNLRLDVNLDMVAHVLSQWGVPLPLSGLSGGINMHGRLQMPRAFLQQPHQWLKNTRADAKLDVTMSVDTWRDRVSDLKSRLDIQLFLAKGALKWQVDKKSSLSFKPGSKWMHVLPDRIRRMHAVQAATSLDISIPQGYQGQLIFAEVWKLKPQKDSQSVLVRYGNKGSKHRLRAKFSRIEMDVFPSIRLETWVLLNAELRDASQLNAATARSNFNIAIEANSKAVKLSVEPRSSVMLKKIRYPGFNVKTAELEFVSPARCGMAMDKLIFECQPVEVMLRVPMFSDESHSLEVKKPVKLHVSKFSVDKSGWQLNGRAELNDLRYQANDQTLLIDHIMSTLDLRSNQYIVGADVYAGSRKLHSKVDIQHHPLTSKGNLHYKLEPVNFTPQRSVTDALSGRQAYPLQLTQGSLKAHGSIRWDGQGQAKNNSKLKYKLNQSSQVDLIDIGGRYLQTGFSGVQIALHLTDWAPVRLNKATRIKIAQLNPGVAIDDIEMLVDAEYAAKGKRRITINSLHAQALGGDIRADKIIIDLERKHNPFTVTVRNMDVAKLLALEKGQGVSGSGYIDAELPMDFSADGLSIRDGRIKARAPGGKLRYLPDERIRKLALSNANINMLVEALADFNYHELTAAADYSPDGRLLLGVRLKGTNPQFQRGRPVHLNVNVEENVLQLIRSLQLGDEIGRGISERVLERHQKE